jgi:hypothetical protein
MERSPLALDSETMRRLGYRTVDMLVDRLLAPPGPVVRSAAPRELRERLALPPPETPAGFDEILADLERDVLPYVARIGHPGYLAFIPGEGTWPGALGDLIASALNVDTCWWLGSSGPSTLELVVVDWLRRWVGYPEGAAGVLVSGGSAANLTALACAREARVGAMDDRAVVYMSDQTHSSLARAARALGFRPDQVRVIPTDERARIRPDALRGAIVSDHHAGRRPLAVIANAGTTAAGAIDDFPELARSAAPTLCGSMSTAPTARSRASPSAAGRRSPGSSSPTRSRSTRTNGCTSRSSWAPCSCVTARRCAAASRSIPTTSATSKQSTKR